MFSPFPCAYPMAIQMLYRPSVSGSLKIGLRRIRAGTSGLRFGESREKLTTEEKRELQIAKGQVDHEKEPCGLGYPDDFRPLPRSPVRLPCPALVSDGDDYDLSRTCTALRSVLRAASVRSLRQAESASPQRYLSDARFL
jgi:hypothetical protein